MNLKIKMDKTASFSLVKPTLDTPFHIDFEWWKDHDSNWRIFLFSCLCAGHQEMYKSQDRDTLVDWVDPVTAIVTQVDGLQSILMEHCAKQPDFFTENTAMIDAIFRVFLANGNTPLNVLQIAEKIGKPPETILRTISGLQVYKGIRPCQ